MARFSTQATQPQTTFITQATHTTVTFIPQKDGRETAMPNVPDGDERKDDDKDAAACMVETVDGEERVQHVRHGYTEYRLRERYFLGVWGVLQVVQWAS